MAWTAWRYITHERRNGWAWDKATHPNLNGLVISNLHQHCSVIHKVIDILGHVTSLYVTGSTQPAVVFVELLRMVMG